MTGAKTYLRGHSSRAGQLVKLVELNQDAESEIENALNRVLSDAEKSEIEDKVSLYQSLRIDHNNDAVPSQSIKKTLAGIGKLSGEKAEVAYMDCDARSEYYILEALYKLGARSETLLAPPGALISKAALYALDNLPTKDGPRTKSYQRWLADYVVNCWQALGGEGPAWIRDDKISPMVRFGATLFSAVENYKFDEGTVLSLLKESQEHNGTTCIRITRSI